MGHEGGSTRPTRVGIVGAGAISGQYLDYFAEHGPAAGVLVTAIADLDPARAARAVDGRPGVRAATPDEVYAADDVDIVLNLTIPAAHAPVALAAIAGGKHVYGEKPIAATSAEARQVLAAAAAAGVRVGAAPDTVLGRGTQTARALIDAGRIGQPLAATAFFACAGHERWHPDPDFYYQPGGGPLFDMGPYYLTALVHLLGPVESVVGAASRSGAERVVGSGPRAGERFPVEVATHVTGVLRHRGGALSTVLMSFDVIGNELPRIEVHGTAGSVSVPDPNYFEGPVRLATHDSDGWREVPLSHGYAAAGRGLGLADLARALRTDCQARADGAVALHVLEVMEALLGAAEDDRARPVASDCARPPLVPESARVAVD
ncbi:Gfo/Idh/MocA family oxidoreductase [Streptomyces sp. DSM 44915]|uniref:Gfo/Idh/MocA family oxidoreductase n=1 Tax=Streptomyces chisholmiae TaxID=3075540 RepID=A0ABU2JKH8_9ACTN|nr:Gfo/Idh/MocA family oxidoreductase [Streptomyces sp. DSM 44915]MDT0264743.1 Gfo/Idh/MocA family oxidoreductase [Streptomyces sp. DSM 44915]